MSVLSPHMTEDTLRLWTQKNNVEYTLELPVKILLVPSSTMYANWLWVYKQSNVPLVEIITRPTAHTIDQATAETAPLIFQQYAIQYIQDAVQSAQEALQEEQELLSKKPPENSILHSIWQNLSTYRSTLRNRVEPRNKKSRHTHQLWFNSKKNVLHYKEETMAVCGDGRWAEFTIYLDNRSKPVQCNCLKGKMGACRIGLSAIDQTIDMLLDTTQNRLHDHITHMMSTPKWEQDIVLLEQVLENASDIKPGELLGWRIKELTDGIQIEPVWCKNQQGKWKQRKAELEYIVKHGTWYMEPEDHIISQLLYIDGQKHTSKTIQQNIHHQIILLLENHPRVFIGGNSSVLAKIEQQYLSICFSKTNLGIEWQLMQNQHEIFPQDLRLSKENLYGSTWIEVRENTCKITIISYKKQQFIEKLSSISKILSADAIPAIMYLIPQLDQIIPVHLDKELRGTELPTNTIPRFLVEFNSYLRIEASVDPFEKSLHNQNNILYTIGSGKKEVYHYNNATKEFVCTQRNHKQELESLQEVLYLFDLPMKDKKQWIVEDTNHIFRILKNISSLSHTYKFEWLSTKPTIYSIHNLQQIHLDIFNKNQDFIVSGYVNGNQENISLWDILPALRRKNDYLLVKGTTWYTIEKEIQEQLIHLADSLSPQKQDIILSNPHILSIHKLLKQGIQGNHTALDSVVQNIIPRIWSQRDFPYTLRPYQEKGVEFLLHLHQWTKGGFLADEMGLGKMIQTLGFIYQIQEDIIKNILIVVPKSTISTWIQEFNYCIPKMQIQQFTDYSTIPTGTPTCIITTYSMLQKHVNIFKTHTYAIVIFDEAQYIKNPQSSRTQAAKLLQSDFNIALTGTPIENKLVDIWSIFDCIIPSLLGTWQQFRQRFMLPIEEGNKQRLMNLQYLVSPFLLHRKKVDVCLDLPEKIEINTFVSLSSFERESYDNIRTQTIEQLRSPQTHRLEILANITKLRQICCHRGLVVPTAGKHSSKLDRTLELLEMLLEEGRKILIFSQFVQLLTKLREFLDERKTQHRQWEYCYLDGQTSTEKRNTEIETFQKGNIQIFLLSLKAGGVGINLTEATEVILLDPWWNPAIEDQASDRAHRIGQKNVVSIFRIIAQDTIESQILEIHRQKRALADSILSVPEEQISMDDLTQLLSHP